jgi:hypothetical protein
MAAREGKNPNTVSGGMTAWTRKLGSYLFRGKDGHQRHHRQHEDDRSGSQLSNSSATGKDEAASEANISDVLSVANSEDRNDVHEQFGGVVLTARDRMRSLLSLQGELAEDDEVIIEDVSAQDEEENDPHSSGSDSSDYGELEDDEDDEDDVDDKTEGFSLRRLFENDSRPRISVSILPALTL